MTEVAVSARIQRSGVLVSGFVALLVLAGAGMLAATIHEFGLGVSGLGDRWIELAVLVVLVLIAELKPISIARAGGLDEIVASTTFAFAIFITFGPVPAMLAQAVASVVADAVDRKPVIRIAFNVAQYWLAFGASAGAFLLVTDHPTPFVTADLNAVSPTSSSTTCSSASPSGYTTARRSAKAFSPCWLAKRRPTS
jgi:hypothetical protein